MDAFIAIIGMMLLEMVVLLLCATLGKEWVYMFVLVNMLLITMLGGKLISIFGYITNTGNVFYVFVFLAAYLLTDTYGKESARTSLWIAFAGVLTFMALALVSIVTSGVAETAQLESALNLVFVVSPRIMLGSLIAFLVAQNVNIYLYARLREYYQRSSWTAAISASVLAQLFDSIVFFTIAFSFTIPFQEVAEILIVGYLLKVILTVVTAPLIGASNALARAQSTHHRS